MWDPAKYLDYDELRARPFFDLMARVTAERPRRVADLGCGPGNLTVALARRWPDAELEAIDSSPEMVTVALKAGVPARVADVVEWEPAPDTDVVVSNAVLHWVPGHQELLRRWVRRLPSGAWFAMQVPGNMNAPSHTLVRELAAAPQWSARVAHLVLREDQVDTPQRYADLFADLGCGVDVWETTYVQRLTGPDAVLEWISGSSLRPIRAALESGEWQVFRGQLAPLLEAAYPRRKDGSTWFPFRRLFAVARVD